MENEEMKDRIAHIIRAKNLTAAEFAIQLGIQPSSVSHLLSGRNNPSLDFVKKLKETFPEYTLDWIILGTGPMTSSEPLFGKQVFSEERQVPVQSETNDISMPEGTLFHSEEAMETFKEAPTLLPKSGVKQIILVYDDRSFEVLSPR